MKFSKQRLLTAVFSYFGHCPTPTRLRWARVLGWLAPRLLRSRAHIVRTNLALCFPELSNQERQAIFTRHFQLLALSVLDRGVIWFAPPERLLETVQITGMEHLHTLIAAKHPVIMLAPHFIALDAAASRVTYSLEAAATIYTQQSDPDFDAMIRKGRSRFNTIYLINRREGVRGLIRLLRKGIPLYYLPDMDFGHEGAAFVPFFGVQAATLLATAQIAKNWNAAVVPIVSRLDPETGQYQVQVLPALEDFPGEQSLEEATARLNQLIESWVRPDPAQYYWVHRRFKTRPQGEPRPY